ncbi:hypothetical protein [Alistipes putredinis]|nr:hypothetical protein [Alistipes putredinis]MCQ5065493.1 hypothetical protein [Alistipes putredinis]MCQ5077826.1 hypothetical protein [Alistipes putredinis]
MGKQTAGTATAERQTAGTATAERQTDRRTARRRVFTEKIP